MKDDVVKELKDAIKALKLDILRKQEELNILREKYEELSGEELED